MIRSTHRAVAKRASRNLHKILRSPIARSKRSNFLGSGRVTDLQQCSPLAQSSARSDDQQHVALVSYIRTRCDIRQVISSPMMANAARVAGAQREIGVSEAFTASGRIDVGGPHFGGSRVVKITVRYCDDYTEAQVRQFSSCDNVVTGGGSSNGGLTMISIVDDDISVRRVSEFAHQIPRLRDSDFRIRRGVFGVRVLV